MGVFLERARRKGVSIQTLSLPWKVSFFFFFPSWENQFNAALYWVVLFSLGTIKKKSLFPGIPFLLFFFFPTDMIQLSLSAG